MNQIDCPVCSTPMTISPARSRKAKRPKTFLMLKCSGDGRHFRGFINDEDFVSRVLERAGLPGSGKGPESASTGSAGTEGEGTHGRRL